MLPREQLDRDKLQKFLGQVSGSLGAGINCAVTLVGDQLGLYRALNTLGSATSEELAAHTGFSERWLREWLRHQACNRQIEYEREEFDPFKKFEGDADVFAGGRADAFGGNEDGGQVGIATNVEKIRYAVRSFIGRLKIVLGKTDNRRQEGDDNRK